MSHQTGIQASLDLQNFLAHAKEGNSVRVLKICIVDEELVLDRYEPPHGSSNTDWDRLIIPLLEEDQACYIFYRDDTKNSQGYEWVYINYIPDIAPVKQKMLYAGTKSTLKAIFGSGHIKDELFGTTLEDVNMAGFTKHKRAQNAPAPLSMREEELEEIKKTEVDTAINVDTKHQTLSGVAFPVSPEAIEKLKELGDHRITYVQLCLDLEAETIDLASYDTIEADRLSQRIPTDHARYHYFLFRHTHEGDYQESIIFIYSMPGYKCSIKERMLYSSCKAPLIEMSEQVLGMEIVRKVEIDEPNEVTPEFLMEEVHPKKTIVRNKFEKPKGPQGRGPRRMTKPKPSTPQE